MCIISDSGTDTTHLEAQPGPAQLLRLAISEQVPAHVPLLLLPLAPRLGLVPHQRPDLVLLDRRDAHPRRVLHPVRVPEVGDLLRLLQLLLDHHFDLLLHGQRVERGRLGDDLVPGGLGLGDRVHGRRGGLGDGGRGGRGLRRRRGGVLGFLLLREEGDVAHGEARRAAIAARRRSAAGEGRLGRRGRERGRVRRACQEGDRGGGGDLHRVSLVFFGKFKCENVPGNRRTGRDGTVWRVVG